MEIPAQQDEVVIGGSFKPQNFRIAQTRHTFQILSSGLYSDKEKAIVRELACNAWDAHVAAGNQSTPFIIYLPNRIEPFFKIRDFGTGLSHDDVMEIYTTYFESTKQKSNDQIGCFGLGSKSPFAYTKNFTVVSYFNGEKRTYNMIINGQGLPEVVPVAMEVTNEPNGLEVFFAVKRGDMYEFTDAAKKVLRPFDTLPDVKGIANFEPGEDPEALIDGGTWKIFKTRNMPKGMTEQCAVMGNVEYPLSEQKGFSPHAKMVLSMPIKIIFPIGSFEVTPSRESVSWTDYSKVNVNQVLENIYDAVVKHVTVEVSGATTLWEAKRHTWKLLHNSVLSRMKIRPLWKGMVVSPTTKITEGVVVNKLWSKLGQRQGNEVITCKSGKVNTIDPVTTEFFLDDFKSSHYRVSSYVRDFDKENKHVYLISAPKRKALKELLKAIGISAKEIRLASSIPKKIRTSKGGGVGGRRSRLAGTKARAFILNDKFRGYADNCWDEKEVDLTLGGVYVQIHRYKVVSAPGYSVDRALEPTYLEDPLNHLKRIVGAVNMPEVIGVKTAKVAKFQKHPKWVTLKEYIQEKVLEVWTADKDLRTAYLLYRVARKTPAEESARMKNQEILSGTSALYTSLLKDGYDKTCPTSPFLRFCAVVSRILSKKAAANSIRCLDGWVTVKADMSIKEPDYRGVLLKHYPLLGIAEGGNSYSDKELWEHKAKTPYLVEYIKFMDGLRAQGVKV
jgi:hypothetical protein